MITCINCGHQNPDDSNICSACQSKLEKISDSLENRKDSNNSCDVSSPQPNISNEIYCSKCGAPNSKESHFCKNCGFKLPVFVDSIERFIIVKTPIEKIKSQV